MPEVKKEGNKVFGNVIWIDRFGNLITNISRQLVGTRNIKVRICGREIFGVSNSYDEVEKGQLLSIWGSYDTLEISVREGNAKELLNPSKFEKVEVEIIE